MEFGARIERSRMVLVQSVQARHSALDVVDEISKPGVSPKQGGIFVADKDEAQPAYLKKITRLSASLVQAFVSRAGTLVAPIVDAIAELCKKSRRAAGHVAGKFHWIYVFATQTLTHIVAHAKRGRQAFDDMSILAVFKGVLMHGGWGAPRHAGGSRRTIERSPLQGPALAPQSAQGFKAGLRRLTDDRPRRESVGIRQRQERLDQAI